MRIKSSQLISPMTVQVTGEEGWLGTIYSDFSSEGSGASSRLIKGELILTPRPDGSVHVQGSLLYTPQVSCARCDKSIDWQLKSSIDTLILPEDHSPLPRDMSLNEDDVESYSMVGDEIDLEMLVNDAIQTALPSQFLALQDDGKTCKICFEDVSGAKVFSAGESESTSPFAALGKIKVPQ